MPSAKSSCDLGANLVGGARDREVVDQLAGQVGRVIGFRREVAGVVVVVVATLRQPRHRLGHAVGRVAPHRVGDVVRARRRRPAAAIPGLLLVVADPHGGEHGELDGVRVAPGLLGARPDVVDRPADGRLVDTDVEHDAVGQGAGDAQVLRPRRGAS